MRRLCRCEAAWFGTWRMTAPTMYLLTGLSFAGKSVLAREIARA